jgi:imidazolonepropionase-like amidohydrolase
MRYDSLAEPKVRRLAAAAAVLAAALPVARADRAPVFALVGGRVVTVSGAVHEGGTLILRDGLVEAVGTGLAVPPDARVVDAKGLVITPGLIDAFGGVGLPTGSRPPGQPAAAAPPADAGLRPEALALEAIRPADALKARDSGITTALVIPRDGVLPGRSVLVNLSGETAEGMVLRQPAALHLNMTTLARRYPGSLMGTMAHARQSLLDAGRYRDEWAAWERAPRGRKRPRFDAGLQAWTDVLGGRAPLVVGTRNENDVRRALALADEFKVRVIVAGGRQASRALPVLQARRPPLLLGVNFDPPAPAGFFGTPDEDRTRREIDEAEREPARLHEAGVPFALVSGHSTDLVAGVRKAVERGLPREAALRALTLAPAEALGVADRLGSLEPGKIANVVAWTAEPLTADARPRMVFVDGELYEPDETPKGGGARAAARADASDAPSPAPSIPPAPSPSPRAAPAPEMTPPDPRPLPRTFAVTGATILTASAQGTIASGTIVVRDGKIVSVAAGPAPSGIPVVNAEGQFVTPGLIDAHSHIAIEGNVNECTDVVTAEVRVTDVIDHRDPDIYRNLAGGVTAANVLHGSCNAIGGQNAVIKLRRGKPPAELVFAAAPRGIKFALGENPKRSNFSVPGQRRYPGTRMGVEVVIRRAFQDALAYRREWQEYESRAKAARGEREVPPRRDLRLETLVDVLEGRVLVHAHCYRADEILMLIQVAEEFGFKIKSFQHVLEGYKVATEIARHGAGASTFSDWWAYKMEAWDAIPYNAAIMAAHGVVVSLNSDSAELARRLYWEAAKAVKYGGVSEDEALKMVTLNPAVQLGIEKHVGSIEPGKDADLAIFSAHPFSPDARVEMTIIEGVAYFDRQRDLAARPPAATAAAGDAQ